MFLEGPKSEHLGFLLLSCNGLRCKGVLGVDGSEALDTLGGVAKESSSWEWPLVVFLGVVIPSFTAPCIAFLLRCFLLDSSLAAQPYEMALKTTAVPLWVCTMLDEIIEDKRRHKCDGFAVLVVAVLVFSCPRKKDIDPPIVCRNLHTLSCTCDVEMYDGELAKSDVCSITSNMHTKK